MSAVSGIINKSEAPVDRELLQKMNAALAHRQKDGASVYMNANAGLGCCRMIRYVHNQGEALPFEDGELAITANVHLHNRVELQKKLGFYNGTTMPMPDAYLVLHAFRKWGELCVHQLEGEYVFAIWNKASKELFIANDHMGHKCLYYYESGDQFIFSSELKAIEAVKTTANYIDEYALIKRLLRETCPENTYNSEIKKLVGGHCISVRRNKVSVKKYSSFERPFKYSFSKDEDWYECLYDLVHTSIVKRMDTGGRIGIKLSGGLDSAAIAGILAPILEKKNQPLYAFSSVADPRFENAVEDERKYIKLVTDRHPNIILHTEPAALLSPVSNIEKSLNITEDYVHNILFMFIKVMEDAQNEDISVMFTGFGGDQWISTKGRGVIYALLKQGSWKEAIKLIKEVAAFYKQHPLITVNAEVLSKMWLHQLYYRLTRPNDATYNFVKHALAKKYQAPYLENSPVFQPGYVRSGLVSQGLQHLDQLTAYHGMIAATPFQDRHVLEFLADVPLQYFLKGGYKRSLFRNAFHGVMPKEILWRFTKSNYIPDNAYRLHSDMATLDSIFNSEEATILLDKYIDKKKFRVAFENCLQSRSGMAPSGELLYISKLAAAFQSYQVLKKNKAYLQVY